MKRLFLCVFVAVALVTSMGSAADFTPVPDQAMPDQVAVPDQVAADCAPRIRTITRTVTRMRTVRCPEPCAEPCALVRLPCPPVRCRCASELCLPVMLPCRSLRVRCCPVPTPGCKPECDKCEKDCERRQPRRVARAFVQANVIAAAQAVHKVRCHRCGRCCPVEVELPALTPQPENQPTPAVRP